VPRRCAGARGDGDQAAVGCGELSIAVRMSPTVDRAADEVVGALPKFLWMSSGLGDVVGRCAECVDDEREDLAGDVALEAAEGVEVGFVLAVGVAAGDVVAGALVWPADP
jgi:hypothetical protein